VYDPRSAPSRADIRASIWFLGRNESILQTAPSIGSAVSAGIAGCPIHEHTDHKTCDVCSDSPHTMRPKTIQCNRRHQILPQSCPVQCPGLLPASIMKQPIQYTPYFFTARRYISAIYAVVVFVLISQACIKSKRLNGSRWLLAWRLPFT